MQLTRATAPVPSVGGSLADAPLGSVEQVQIFVPSTVAGEPATERTIFWNRFGDTVEPVASTRNGFGAVTMDATLPVRQALEELRSTQPALALTNQTANELRDLPAGSASVGVIASFRGADIGSGASGYWLVDPSTSSPVADLVRGITELTTPK